MASPKYFVNIASGTGLSPVQRQASTRTNIDTFDNQEQVFKAITF